MSKTISDLIQAFGGTSAYARVIGKEYSTASEQKRSGSIPVAYWPAIIAAARDAGSDLDWVTSDALVTMHVKSSAQQAEPVQCP